MSPPTWGRGLKLRIYETISDVKLSPPTWGRGLKLKS